MPHRRCVFAFKPFVQNMIRLLDFLTFVIVSIVFWESFIFETSDAVRYLGYEAAWRDKEDHDKSLVFITDPSQGATSDGIVTGWHVYTTRGRRSQVVHLQIWRPVADHRPKIIDYPDRYRRVGETVIAARWVGHNFFALFPADRIEVRRGDVIGIYFPGYNPIPWSSVPCNHSNEHLARKVAGRFEIGDTEAMFQRSRRDPNPCRRYSLNATIMDADEVLQYDYDYEDTTDGRYERRPYGRYLRKRRNNGAASTRYAAVARPRLSDTRLLFAVLCFCIIRIT